MCVSAKKPSGLASRALRENPEADPVSTPVSTLLRPVVKGPEELMRMKESIGQYSVTRTKMRQSMKRELTLNTSL